MSIDFTKTTNEFEINIPIFHPVTGKEIKRKSFSANSGGEICEWYEKNASRNVKKKEKKEK